MYPESTTWDRGNWGRPTTKTKNIHRVVCSFNVNIEDRYWVFRMYDERKLWTFTHNFLHKNNRYYNKSFDHQPILCFFVKKQATSEIVSLSILSPADSTRHGVNTLVTSNLICISGETGNHSSAGDAIMHLPSSSAIRRRLLGEQRGGGRAAERDRLLRLSSLGCDSRSCPTHQQPPQLPRRLFSVGPASATLAQHWTVDEAPHPFISLEGITSQMKGYCTGLERRCFITINSAWLTGRVVFFGMTSSATDYCTAVQSQKAVSAHLENKQILPFGFLRQYTSLPVANHVTISHGNGEATSNGALGANNTPNVAERSDLFATCF